MYDHEKIKLADNTYQPLNSPDISIEAQHNSAELRKNYLKQLKKALNLSPSLR